MHQKSQTKESNDSDNHSNRRLKLSLKYHSIDIKKQCIKIKKNLLDYSQISPIIKYFFLQVYKECVKSHCLDQIFEGFYDREVTSNPARSIQIKDMDALAITIKIMKCLQRKRQENKLEILKGILQKYDSKLKQCFDFREQINKKHDSIHKLINLKTQKITQEQSSLLLKLKAQLEEVNNRIQKLSEQRKRIESKLMVYFDRFHLKMPSNQLSICLKKTISKMARNLIKDSILLIIQTQNQVNYNSSNHVYVVFEQPYATIKIEKKDITKIISSNTYIEKQKKCEGLRNNFSLIKFKDLMCCHHCMAIYDSSKLYFCNKKIGKSLTKGYDSSDYRVYRNNTIQSNYFKQENSQQVLSFFTYNQCQGKKLTCNRGYCAQCLEKIYKIRPEQFSCPYCDGMCFCQRCQLGVTLVKLIAHDLDYDQNELRNYHSILDLLRPHQSKYVLESYQLRRPQTILQSDLIAQSMKNDSQVPNFSKLQQTNNTADLVNDQNKNIENDQCHLVEQIVNAINENEDQSQFWRTYIDKMIN